MSSKMNRLHKLAVLLRHYIRTRWMQSWPSRAVFERWQERKMQQHLQYVQAHSPFYRKLWEDRPLTQWRQFPIIDKTVMMSNFDQLNTAGINKETALSLAFEAEKTRNFSPQINDVTVGLSSGTSGNRGLFLVSEQEQAAWAGTMLAKLLPKPLWHAERIAFFLRANSNLYESVRGGKLQFQYFDLLESVQQHVERLNEYKPSIIAAPPSLLRLLANQKTEGQLGANPQRIISVAEVLDPLDARYIEQAFGVPLHQVYQCTEGFLASTCRYGTIHLNEDIVHIEKEYIAGADGQRKFIPIVTDFSRTTQPIIRYRLNDVLTEAEGHCPCGSLFTAIESIEGRCDDVFYLEAIQNGKLTPVFPDYMTRAIIASSDGIEQYRIVQHGKKDVELQLLLVDEEARDEVQRQVTAAIKELMHRLDCRMPNLIYSRYVAQSGAYKLRRVERRWSIDPASDLL